MRIVITRLMTFTLVMGTAFTCSDKPPTPPKNSSQFAEDKPSNSEIKAKNSDGASSQASETDPSAPTPTPTAQNTAEGPTPTPTINSSGCSEGGVRVADVCWYHGEINTNCTTTCSNRGGYHTATRDYAGSNGTSANCIAVYNAFGYAPPDAPLIEGEGSGSLTGFGCTFTPQFRRLYRFISPVTDPSRAHEMHRRFCACNS